LRRGGKGIDIGRRAIRHERYARHNWLWKWEELVSIRAAVKEDAAESVDSTSAGCASEGKVVDGPLERRARGL
jgi:hypothetical protein